MEGRLRPAPVNRKAIERRKERERLFRNRDLLTNAIVKRCRADRAFQDNKQGNRLALEVFVERLSALPGAELRLMGAYILADDFPELRKSATLWWWQAVQEGWP